MSDQPLVGYDYEMKLVADIICMFSVSTLLLAGCASESDSDAGTNTAGASSGTSNTHA